MKHLYLLLGFCAVLFSASCHPLPETTDTISAHQLKPFGRTAINDRGHLELISSASYVGVSFVGKSCTLYVSINNADGHNYLQYALDGEYQKRIRISGNNPQPIVIDAPTPGQHRLYIYKATEAHTGPVCIQKIAAQQLGVLSPASLPLIEFIGNSITCGAAADPTEVPCGTGEYHDQHNAYLAYGPRLSRALHTNFLLSSVSGIGIYRNWNSDGPVMPEVYERINFQPDGQPWDFSTYSPAIVSIALGTNDFSDGDGKRPRLPFDSAAFVSRYTSFVQLVKTKYPAAQIALLSSPMLNGAKRTLLQNCLYAVKQKIDSLSPSGKRLEVYCFKPMQARGCTGHPNIEDHAIMAQELIPFFRKLL